MMIESYLWAGAASGPLYAQSARITMGATVSTSRPTAPARASQVLDSWVSDWTTATGRTFRWRWDRGANRVTIDNSSGTAFTLDLLGSTAAALGFSSASYTGSGSYTAESAPRVFVAPVAIEYGAPLDAAEMRLRALRYGRHRSAWWAGHDVIDVQVVVTAEQAAAMAGPLLRGRVRIDCGSQSAAAAQASNLAGYLEGYVAGVSGAREMSGGAHVEIDLQLVRAESASYVATGRATDPLQYGHTLLYWMTIEGLPYVFSEGLGGAATGKTLPSGYTAELPDLDVSNSPPIGSKIDRDKGIGAGLPLQWSLIDSTTVRGLLQRWTKYARLRNALTATATSIDVEDATGWSAGQQLWFGTELVQIGAVAAGPTFTGCTRAIAGYPYAIRLDDAAAYGSDKPRWWRGRHVTLHAVSVDPFGSLPAASALAAHSETIWRGRVDAGPRLADDGLWAFSALALDRSLSKPLASLLSGEVVGTEFKVFAKPSAFVLLDIQALNSGGVQQWKHTLKFEPFAALSASTLISSSQARDLMSTAWTAAVSAAGATGDLDALSFVQALSVPPGYQPNSATPLNNWHLSIGVDTAAAAVRMVICGEVFGEPVYADLSQGAFAAGTPYVTNIKLGIDPYQVNKPAGTTLNTHATIKVDGDPSLAPSSGMVKIGDVVYSYDGSGTSSGLLALAGLRVASDNAVPAVDFMGQSAEIMLEASGLLGDAVVTAIESSGTGQRGTYDTAKGGYGIDEDLVDETGIRSLLSSGWLATQPVRLVYRDKSLIDLVGGLLTLQQRALVGRQVRAEPYAYALTAVDTAPAGSLAVATITDADLVVGDGDAARTLTDRPFINQIRIEGDQGGDGPVINLRDAQSIQANGARSLELTVPLVERAEIVPLAASWGAARFAGDQVLQALELRVAPWVVADVGDVVSIDCSHFRVWSFSSAEPGYDGVGRVIGRALDLDRQVVTLTILIDGLSLSRGLCPSAKVLGFDSATSPTYIDVAAQYLDHYVATLDGVSSAFLTIYRPGQAEGVTQKAEINAAAMSGSNCRLTVASVSGSPTLVVNDSHVTIPQTADSNSHQRLYMHDGDGSVYS